MSRWTDNWVPGTVSHYRKKIIDVEAFRYGRENEPAWFEKLVADGVIVREGEKFLVKTPVGDSYAWPGDWIVRGPRTFKDKEDVYPVHHDTFMVLFEPTPEYAKILTP